jgi:hypothetical protein
MLGILGLEAIFVQLNEIIGSIIKITQVTS